MFNHYIRVNAEGIITYGFSSCFDTPIKGDICIGENMGGQFQLKFADGSYSPLNPNLYDDHMNPLYRYENGVIVAV